ncbi:MAG: FtsX-like permease family protein [Defluviicoccus sp.]|nr:FtsX-like permease family protein [Defluviicoccus sp.]MDE0279448.1 FtsX-like permease family protein [Defluviicoccus sp.]
MNGACVAFRFALRELRGGLRGFRIFVACLAVGVAAVAAVGSTTSAIRDGIEADGRKTLGGDISIRSLHRDIGAERKAWLEASGTVSRALRMRAMARTADRRARSLIELKAVDGVYPLYGALALTPAQSADGALARDGNGVWGAAVEERLLRKLGVARGARIRIGDADFEIRGTVAHEPDRLGDGGLIGLGPKVIVSADSIAETGLVRPGSLVRYFYKIRLEPGVDLDGWRERLDNRFPEAAWRVRDRTNASPAAQRFIDGTQVFLTLIGLTALLVGGVGVGNAVGNYLAGRMETIATLKCVGASGGTIFGVYLIQILAMAAVGIAIGLVLGAAAPPLAGELVNAALGVEARFGVYPGVLGLAAAFGLLVALLFSIWPVARACEVPGSALFRAAIVEIRVWPRPAAVAATAAVAAVLAALVVATADNLGTALWFVGGSAAAFALFRAAGYGLERGAARFRRVRGASLRLALANLHRPGAPSAKVVLSLGLGLAVLVATVSIEGNLRHQVANSLPANAPDFYFVDLQPDQVAAFERVVETVPGTNGLRRVPMLRGRIVGIAGKPASEAAVDPSERWLLRGDRGITWSAAPSVDMELVEGRWWPADYAGPPLISLSRDAALGLGIGVGDTLTVDVLGRAITGTIANLREVRWRTLRINFVMVFSPGALEDAPQTHLATLKAPDEALAGIEAAVTDRFPNVTAIRVGEVLGLVREVLDRIAATVRVAAGVTLVAGILVLAGAAAAGHRRRVYDSVVLKVLGATRRRVLVAYAIEYGLLGAATAAVAGFVGTVAAWAAVTQMMEFEWLFQPWIALATVAGSAALTLAFGFVGTWRALGDKAAPLLRNE